MGRAPYHIPFVLDEQAQQDLTYISKCLLSTYLQVTTTYSYPPCIWHASSVHISSNNHLNTKTTGSFYFKIYNFHFWCCSLEMKYFHIFNVVSNCVYSLPRLNNVDHCRTIIYFDSHSWGLVIDFNPHPVMSSNLHGPPAGPRKPGTMILWCVEFMVQSKNKNSSYWLSHITTALNWNICSICSKYPMSYEEHD